MMIQQPFLKSNSPDILAHLKNYYTKIISGESFPLSDLKTTFNAMDPVLGENCRDYIQKRLPQEIENNPKIVLINHPNQLNDIDTRTHNWKAVKATSRRRFVYYNQVQNILAFQLSSDSDIDDIINNLLARNISLNIQYLKNPDCDYFQNAKNYVDDLIAKTSVLNITDCPVYFISSNLHSIVNLTGGFLYHYQNDIFNYIENNLPDLQNIWNSIKENNNILRVNDFLYYISNNYFNHNPDKLNEKKAYEYELGFIQIKPEKYIDCGLQIIPIRSIAQSKFIDPFLKISDKEKISSSQAIIINIEYPLGFTAYFILKELLNRFQKIKGVYIMGKAAILSGDVGDIQIPNTVLDERTSNIFTFPNVFNNNFPKTTFQSNILNNQKAVSVFGTFLENMEQLVKYNSDNFNLVEMESGPYLNAIYEFLNKQLPFDSKLNIENIPFDFGIANYASDNPLSQTLGEGSMNLKGIEPTYLSALAIMQRIIDLETI
jgi:hypothetical protein